MLLLFHFHSSRRKSPGLTRLGRWKKHTTLLLFLTKYDAERKSTPNLSDCLVVFTNMLLGGPGQMVQSWGGAGLAHRRPGLIPATAYGRSPGHRQE